MRKQIFVRAKTKEFENSRNGAPLSAWQCMAYWSNENQFALLRYLIIYKTNENLYGEMVLI